MTMAVREPVKYPRWDYGDMLPCPKCHPGHARAASISWHVCEHHWTVRKQMWDKLEAAAREPLANGWEVTG